LSGEEQDEEERRADGEIEIPIFGKLRFKSRTAGKIIFSILLSLLFLYHCYIELKVSFEYSLLVYLISFAAFIITLKFGCVRF